MKNYNKIYDLAGSVNISLKLMEQALIYFSAGLLYSFSIMPTELIKVVRLISSRGNMLT